MRTIKGLPISQDGNDSNFPDGQIRNESTTEVGTPVVREIYGDVLTNIYKILRDSKITPNQLEDGENNGYQLLKALKFFVNEINDLKQVITVNNHVISTLLNIDTLPDDYVFVARISENVIKSESYTITGSGSDSYNVTLDSDITASSLVIVVLNSSSSTITSVSNSSNTSISNSVLDVSFSQPLSFNDSSKLLFISSNQVLTTDPMSYNVQNTIQVSEGNGVLIVLDAIVLKNRLICHCLDVETNEYKLFSFLTSNLNSLEGEITIPNNSSSDNSPYIMCDGEFIYFTNSSASINNDVENFKIGKYSFDENSLTLSSVSFSEIENTFQKTTNYFITDGFLFTYISGVLSRYDLNGNSKDIVGVFNSVNGQVFKFESETYFSTGEVASKWNY